MRIDRQRNVGERMCPGMDVFSADVLFGQWKLTLSDPAFASEDLLDSLREAKTSVLSQHIEHKRISFSRLSKDHGECYRQVAFFTYDQLKKLPISRNFWPTDDDLERSMAFIVKGIADNDQETASSGGTVNSSSYDIAAELMQEISPRFYEGMEKVIASQSSDLAGAATTAALDMWLLFFYHAHPKIGNPY